MDYIHCDAKANKQCIYDVKRNAQNCPLERYLWRCMTVCLVQAGTLVHTGIPLLQVILPHKDVHNQDNNSLGRNETKSECFLRHLI